MKFASTNTRWWLQAIAVSALLAGLFLSGFLSGASIPAYAQATRGGGAAPRVPLAKFPGLGSTRFLPAGITQRSLVGVPGIDKNAGKTPPKTGNGQTRAQLGGENGVDVPEKVVNITRLNGTREIQPFWNSDETAVYYSSNASFTGDSAADGFQLYRTPANPSTGTIPTSATPTRLTNEAGANYGSPALNTAGNRIAFTRQRPLAGGGLSPSHLYVALVPSNPVVGDPNSFIPTVPDGNNLISLTNTDASEARPNAKAVVGGRTFSDVEHPSFVSTTQVVFAGRLGADTNYHLYLVNLVTFDVLQLTNGPADERNPSVSPDGRYIAFDSNAANSASPYNGGIPAVAIGVQTRRNVFIIGSQGQTGAAADAVRVFSYSNASGNDFDNIQPAWSRIDRNDFLNPNGNQYYLAYSSNRQPDSLASPTAYALGTTFDIYYVLATTTTGATITPESALGLGNVARRVDTADDSFTFNDLYPTFPPLQNGLRIAFQSNRVGEQDKPNFPNDGFMLTPNDTDLFVATLIDTNAPTLLRWDSSSDTGEIVHINLTAGAPNADGYNPSTASAIRNRDQGLTPGREVFFTVRAEDLQSGIDSVYIQFKNPNSKYQSTAQGGNGVEHKEYDPGFLDFVDDSVSSAFVFTEPVAGGAIPLQWQAGNLPAGLINTTTNVGREYEAEAINAADRASYVNHRANRGGKIGYLPIAGIDDLSAFSGGAFLNRPTATNPATNGVWLKLELLPDAEQQPLLGGPGGRLYGAKWTLPAEASDWYMDVILFDNATNPFSAASRSNWIIYDNVWGMSTANTLSPQSVDLLVVMDYALGQKFFRSRFGSNGNAFGRGLGGNVTNNLPNIWYGVESYFTDPEISRYPDGQLAPNPPGTTPPTIPRQWDTLGPFTSKPILVPSPTGIDVGTPNTLGVNSYIDELLANDAPFVDSGPSIGAGRLPSTGRYSLWRVLSRGPVPTNLLTDYLPTRSTSPPDQFLNAAGAPLETTPRTTLQANRMVIWASPFTANVFAGAGTVQDIQTQDNLRNFVNQGGRLFISGQDIAFALAGNGQANTFFTETLKAQFVNDSGNNTKTLASVGTTTINTDAFGGDATHSYTNINGGSPNTYSPPSGTLDIVHEDLLPVTDWIGDGSFAANAQAGRPLRLGFIDVVVPIGGAVTEYSFGGGAGIISSTSTGGGRVVYSSVGFEGISNDYYTYAIPNGPTVIATHGRRAEIMHNITCAFRSGTITGRMLDQNGTPVTDALVRAIKSGSAENQIAAGTGFTDGNGNWQIQGLAPGFYQVFGYRAGYYTQKSSGELVHGASRASVNLVLKKAAPGGLGGGSGPGGTQSSGGIFRANGTTPVGNITINAVRTDAGQSGPSQVGYTAVSSDGTLSVDGVVLPAGQYSFGTQLPIGDYVVTANPRQIVDGSGQLVDNPTYNAGFATVRVTNPPQPEVTLGAGTTVANNLVQIREGQTGAITFRLGSSPQPVTGRVLNQAGQPLPGVIIGGVISGATPPVVLVQSAAPTDANGVYTLVTTGTPPDANIPEGTYVLTASLVGYSTGTVTVSVGGSGTLTVPDITLTQLQPGSVSGLVTGGARLTTPITGAEVTLFPYVNGAPIDTGSQTTTTIPVATGTNFNFRFASVPPGQYVATARFIPAGTDTGTPLPLIATSAVFTVAESAETANVSIVLTPLQTYPAGLQMIALPNDYSGFTPYRVFGLAPGNDNDEDGAAGTPNDQSIYNVFTVAGFRTNQTGYEFFGQRFISDPSYNADLRFQPGTGYFVRFGVNTPVVLGGRGEASNTFDKQFAAIGWYIIGNPFGTLTQARVQNVPLNLTTDVAFTYQINGVQRNAVLLNQAVTDGAVQRVVFDFSGSNAGSQYRQTTSILPFQGYWFRTYVPNMTVRFTYPATGPTRATSPSDNGKIMAAAVTELMKAKQTRAASQPRSQGGLFRSVTSKSASDWRLQIAARQGDLMETDNSIGVSPEAKDGFDTTADTLKPPMVGGDQSLYLTIDGMDDKGRSVSGFADNIRASGTSVKTWEFTVQTTSEQEVTLFWPNVNRLPRNLDPVLVDTQTGRRISLRTGGASYRYQPKGRAAQRFKIEVNAAASRPLALTNVKTNRVQTGTGEGRATQGAYRFSFTATQEADVTAEIQSMNGRTLRRMQTRAQASLETAFVWDGRDQGGASLPAGTYIISLTAKDANTGALVRQRIPLLSVR